MSIEKDVTDFMEKVQAKDPEQKEFHQAVQEVIESLMPYVNKHPRYQKHKILERIVEPERVILFRVPWMGDNGEIHVNRGYQVIEVSIFPYSHLFVQPNDLLAAFQGICVLFNRIISSAQPEPVHPGKGILSGSFLQDLDGPVGILVHIVGPDGLMPQTHIPGHAVLSMVRFQEVFFGSGERAQSRFN